jgi:hypothetical protein
LFDFDSTSWQKQQSSGREQGKNISRGRLKAPIKLTFKQAVNNNRTDPQCVYWQFGSGSGQWSDQGCTMEDKYEVEVKNINPEDPSDVKVVKQLYVVCSCNHMTSFGLMMDEAETEVCLYIHFIYIFICLLLEYPLKAHKLSELIFFETYFCFCFIHHQSKAGHVITRADDIQLFDDFDI